MRAKYGFGVNMQTSMRLLGQRRFLPLFVTQFLNAFNDNLFKSAMVLLVTYTIYNDPKQEASFSAIAGGLFILPFFLLSALSGQLADSSDKARIIRIIKAAEIGIMLVGALGILTHMIPLMLAALFGMGVHSTFFGPIKYAILPQHLEKDEVLGGTGLVEAGTYVAILAGTIVGGSWSWIATELAALGVIGNSQPNILQTADWLAAGSVIVIALLGWMTAQKVPFAGPEADAPLFKVDFHLIRSSSALVRATMHIPRLFLAIMAISFFWAEGAILAAQFPPLVKNALGADQRVATMFMAIFSVGVAIGSVAVNRLLNGKVSARWSPPSAIVMALFVLDLWWAVSHWTGRGPALLGLAAFIATPDAKRIMLDLLGIAISGGMFVVPLYAFLTTTVHKNETARTVAANNIVNSGAMVLAALLLMGLVQIGVTIEQTLLTVAVATLVAAWISWKLHKACD
jgi:MFS family permease